VVDKSQIFQLKYLFVIIASFVLFMIAKVHPAFVVIGAGLLGAMLG
jgi:hypothetical protein